MFIKWIPYSNNIVSISACFTCSRTSQKPFSNISVVLSVICIDKNLSNDPSKELQIWLSRLICLLLRPNNCLTFRFKCSGQGKTLINDYVYIFVQIMVNLSKVIKEQHHDEQHFVKILSFALLIKKVHHKQNYS